MSKPISGPATPPFWQSFTEEVLHELRRVLPDYLGAGSDAQLRLPQPRIMALVPPEARRSPPWGQELFMFPQKRGEHGKRFCRGSGEHWRIPCFGDLEFVAEIWGLATFRGQASSYKCIQMPLFEMGWDVDKYVRGHFFNQQPRQFLIFRRVWKSTF